MRGHGVDEYPGVPLWVKVSGIIILVLLVVVVVAFVPGEHGPGRHGVEGALVADNAPGTRNLEEAPDHDLNPGKEIDDVLTWNDRIPASPGHDDDAAFDRGHG